jgi:hypothetical protein
VEQSYLLSASARQPLLLAPEPCPIIIPAFQGSLGFPVYSFRIRTAAEIRFEMRDSCHL